MAKHVRGPQLRVSIDQPLIDVSMERDSSHCMIAEAVRDALPHARSISVDLQTIRFSLPDQRVRCTYLTPRNAQLALVRFDQGVAVEPFDFTLRQAHVTPMHAEPKSTSKPKAEPRPRSAAQKAATAKASAVNPNRQKLVTSGSSNGSVPRRHGGKTPPTSSFARRRSFGLRALEF